MPQNQQFLELPRALRTAEGIPHKGQKSAITNYYASKYLSSFFSTYPPGWLPESVIIEGMFIINVTPIRIHSKMLDYVKFLFNRFVGWYVQAGVIEIHIVFDSPGIFLSHPKEIERKRRDQHLHVDNDHEHLEFKDNMTIPSRWSSVIGCRICKRFLVKYLGDAFLQIAPALLRGDQKIYVAGCSDSLDRNACWFVTHKGVEEVSLNLISNAEEADMRVWLHTKWSHGRRKLIFSPDTD